MSNVEPVREVASPESAEAKKLARKQYHREWLARNRDRARQRNMEWRRAHPEKMLECRRRWREKNLDAYNAYQKEYRARNRDRIVEIAQEFRSRNRERIKDQQILRAAKRTGMDLLFHPSAVREAYGGSCWACGSSERVCIDHIVPLSVGGTNFQHNIRLLCVSCNSRKRQKLDHEVKDPEFRERLLLGHEAFTAIHGVTP